MGGGWAGDGWGMGGGWLVDMDEVDVREWREIKKTPVHLVLASQSGSHCLS